MSTGVFRFLQVELPFALGPADGRWVVRGAAGGEIERIVVLGTVGARRADEPSRRKRTVSPPKGDADPAEVPARTQALVQIARATIIDPTALPGSAEADSWLAGIEAQATAEEAMRWLNSLLRAHRIAAANPYTEQLGIQEALAIRAGYGEGEQVADGRWLRAVTLPAPPRRGRRRREAVLRDTRAQERLVALLGGRVPEILGEELALRARRDYDEGRHRLAAIELERAYAAAIVELAGPPRHETLDAHASELRERKPAVTELALQALEPNVDFVADTALEESLTRLEALLHARATLLLLEG